MNIDKMARIFPEVPNLIPWVMTVRGEAQSGPGMKMFLVVRLLEKCSVYLLSHASYGGNIFAGARGYPLNRVNVSGSICEDGKRIERRLTNYNWYFYLF